MRLERAAQRWGWAAPETAGGGANDLVYASERWVAPRVALATRPALPELLGQPDNEALGAADVGEPIRLVVLHHFADQFAAVGAQARDDLVHTLDGEHDAADPEGVHRNVRGSRSDRGRRVELVQLDPA